MGIPERKLLLALCFYVVLMIFAVPSFMLDIRSAEPFEQHLRSYFLCEEQGVNPNNPGLCIEFRDDFRKFAYPELAATSYILLNSFPTVFLVYTLNFMEIKKKLTKCLVLARVKSPSPIQA